MLVTHRARCFTVISHQMSKTLKNSSNTYSISREQLSPVVERDGHYKIYTRRFYMLLLFCICNAMNGAGWITFSPLTDVLKSVCNHSLSLIFKFLDLWSRIVYNKLHVSDIHGGVHPNKFPSSLRS